MMKLKIASLLVITAILAVIAARPVLAQNDNSINTYDERRFKRYMSNVETCLTCHGGYNPIVRRPDDPRHSLWINSELFMQSAHAMLGCQACHTNIDAFGHRAAAQRLVERSCMPCHEPQSDTSQEGIAEGLSEMQATVGIDYNFSVALTACINCHQEQYNEYRESVHGVSVFEHKNKGAPFCIDCHGIHYILPAKHKLSQTNPANIPSTCLRCHGESQIRIQAELTRDIGSSFEESFHGKRGELGDAAVAVCTNCHGSHAIYAPDDPRSRVNMSRIAKTCGECHEGAQLNFATAFTHKTVQPNEQLGLYILKQIYMWVIFLLIAQFVLFTILDLYRYFSRRKARAAPTAATPAGPLTAPPAGTVQRAHTYERFNIHHRIQHFFMAFPFTMLVITGWPMRFPELQVSKIGSSLVGGVEVVGILHRVFGVMLILVSLYHIIYLVIMFLRGKRSRAMLPSWTDAKEALGDIMYWLGLRRERPNFGRYNWIEKVEYYAVIWGTAVMILSGIIIWVPTWITNFLPNWTVAASVIVHGYEALLAGLAIFLWHFYWVHLHPDVYPMSTVWLTGKLTEKEMEHHHPRELADLKAHHVAPEGQTPTAPPDSGGRS
jgi:formate dehydrogenase gamma subunit